MKLNADLSLPATVDSDGLAWIPSPMAGVERRMLERDGEEVARATSLVRYAPGSNFAPHTHGAGEEFLVLEGVFSDETGDFPAGFYVRNPPGSRHKPGSHPGAVIFVKLRQMPSEETASLRLDTRDPTLWRALEAGHEEAALFDAPWERVTLQRLRAGYTGAAQSFPGGVELFLLEGDLLIDGHVHRAGAWLRRPRGARLALSSPGGVLLYLKAGHLA